MNRPITCGFALLLVATAACANTTAAPSIPATGGIISDTGAIFDTRADPAFGDATPALETYLAAAARPPTGPQHFCIIGYDYGEGGKAAQVHWREGKRLIRWEGVSDPAYSADSLKGSRRDLDLAADVVATEADIDSSTYRVTRAWVDRVLSDCAAKGTQYTINR